ncbi:MAG: hypothetical protein CMH27_09625 [Micavibrio sp.]|nr:hypothetical protein [Micavibrio sp.]|tara:strand:+ start:6638 stop:7849 length:1212 start_codon:yes stop_codon:yes gene_type:complete
MTGISTLGQALDQIERLKSQQGNFDLLSYQLSSGKKTDKFSGLGSELLTSKRARASFQSLEVYKTNIDLADNRIEQSLTALREFRVQTEKLRDFLLNFSEESAHQEGDFIRQDDPLTPTVTETTPIGYSSGEMDIDFQTMANYANNIEGFLIDLINRQEEDRYLFSGSDTLNKPLVSTATLTATMETSIANWKNEASPSNITTADFIADMRERVATITNPDAFTDTIVGYNPTMTSGGAGNVYARIDANSEVDYTSLANNQGFRDVLVAVSFLKSENLPPIADVYAEPYTFGDAPIEEGAPGATLDEQRNAFFEVFNAVESMITGALKNIDKEIQNLELARVRLDDAANTNRQQQEIAKSIISDVEDVDINEVAVKLTSVQTSLDASYRITAMMTEMSLVNFI